MIFAAKVLVSLREHEEKRRFDGSLLVVNDFAIDAATAVGDEGETGSGKPVGH